MTDLVVAEIVYVLETPVDPSITALGPKRSQVVIVT